MIKLKSRIAAFLSAAAMALTMLGTVPAAAADQDDLVERDIEITYDGQVVDSFMGVEAKYILEYQWSGPYCCAYFVGNFYEKFFGTLMYDINNYQGKPKVYLAGHTAELRETDSPLPGDVVQNKKYSHVAIVKAVDGDTLTLIEQNWKWNDWKTGKPVCTINRKVNKNDVFVYRLYIDGKESPIPYNKPVFNSVDVTDISNTGYTVKADITAEKGLTQVSFGTYPKSKGESAVKWFRMSVGGKDARASYQIKTSEYGDLNDTYVTIVEAVGSGGIKTTKTVETFVDRQAPVISDAKISEVTAEGYKVTCTVTDNGSVSSVKFPTWTSRNDKDDITLLWETGGTANGKLSGSSAEFYVKTKDHNSETGEYITEINAYDSFGNVSKKQVSVNVNPAASVKLSQSSLTLEAGANAELTYELENKSKASLTDKLTWASSGSCVTVKDGKLTANEVGEATVTVKTSAGKSAKCEVTVNKPVEKLSAEKIADQVFTGKAITPLLTVKDGEKVLEAGKDYEVAYSDNTRIGKAKVKLTGKGFYTGSSEISFEIVPAAADKLAAEEVTTTSAELTWTPSEGADGYIVYAEKDGKRTELARTETTEFSAEELASSGEYVFTVAAYKQVEGKDVLSAESKIKAVTPAEQVTGVSAQRCGSCLSIAWDKQSAASGFEVKLVNDDGEETIVDVPRLSVLSCCFLSGIEGERQISVRAFKEADGERYYGDWSAEILR
ncbi:MAG: GBS Bsp-like repeat-containing protein [Ruminococcus sp.]|nr:GBS Bsp-like repeat-containing protein [Ruminococcus sp.]